MPIPELARPGSVRLNSAPKSHIFQLLFIACSCYLNYKLDTNTTKTKRSISLDEQKKTTIKTNKRDTTKNHSARDIN